MRRRRYWYTLALALLSAVGGGCVSEQYSEFRGTVRRGGALATLAAVQPLWGEFDYRDEKAADAVTGFRLGESKGLLVFIHDREKYVRNGFRMTTDAVSGVYFADWSSGSGEPWQPFVRLDEGARDHPKGIYRLKGCLDVERWKSNVDFRIRLAMRSAGPEPVAIDGLLTSYERQTFRPGQWLGGMLWSLGLVHPTAATQPAAE